LLGLLLLNTALAQGSFRMNDLQQRTAALQDREQQLQIAVDAANNPSRLAAAAQKLGLVAAEDPGFLRLSDGRILGNPQPAHAAPRKKPAATPTPNASVRPSNKPAAGAAAQPRAQASPQPSAKPAAKPSAGPSAKPRH
jgi:cell division septation protein DedD